MDGERIKKRKIRAQITGSFLLDLIKIAIIVILVFIVWLTMVSLSIKYDFSKVKSKILLEKIMGNEKLGNLYDSYVKIGKEEFGNQSFKFFCFDKKNFFCLKERILRKKGERLIKEKVEIVIKKH